MRKNDVRKWIHATLDMLPLLIIPIFALAVRSDNNYQPIEVTSNEFESVDFNQRVYNGDFDDLTSWSVTSGSFSVNDNVCSFLANGQSYLDQYNIPFDVNHHCVFTADIKLSSLTSDVRVGVRNSFMAVSQTTEWQTVRALVVPTPNDNGVIFFRVADNRVSNNDLILVKNCMVFDLTQMFGVGNEPTLEQFNSYFINDYYSYTLSSNVLIDVGDVIFNDTDVGSQMVYTLYNSVEKYFNFNNVFTFDQIYDWLSLNIFAGQPPLSVFIVWNIFLYEFLMDLLFLLYALFMFFIDMCTNLIERFTCQARGGR